MEGRKQFVKLENEILFNSKITANAKILLLVMRRHKNNNGIVNKSYRKLAEYSGIAEGNIKRYIKELIEQEFIESNNIAGKEGSYKIKLASLSTDYTEVLSEYISNYPASIIINYYQLMNLKRMSGGFEIQRFTSKYNARSNWLTLGQVLDVIITLDEAGLINFQYSISEVSNEHFQIKKETEPPNDSVLVEDKNNSTAIISVPRENIAPKPSMTNPNDLIQYFYSKTGGKCANWGHESKLIKNLLQSFSAADLMCGMDYIAKKGHTNLFRLSQTINEAIKINQIKSEFNKIGTAAYLVKKHHQALNIKPNSLTLPGHVAKVQAIIDEHDYNIAEKVIDYMINQSNKELNFIGGAVDVVLADYNPEAEKEIERLDMRARIQNLKDDYKTFIKLDLTETEEAKKMAEQFNALVAEYKTIYGVE